MGIHTYFQAETQNHFFTVAPLSSQNSHKPKSSEKIKNTRLFLVNLLIKLDIQHIQLIEYLNQLEEAIMLRDKGKGSSEIASLHDYTISHFTFEEALMEEAQYPYAGPHKHVHQTLIKKVVEFDSKLKADGDIKEDLYAF